MMKIEIRLKRLEDRYKTLYHRTYAATKRRDRIEQRLVEVRRISYQNRMRRLDKMYSKYEHILKRLGNMSLRMGKGKIIVYLSTTQRNKLQYWLDKDFRTE